MIFCARCLLPETAESLTFDAQGVCSVCRQVEYKQKAPIWNEREQRLDRIIEKYRGKHDYDCLVPFSGGKDSTFTLWYLVKVKKLKPLVVRFDHGFFRPTVQDNSLRTFRTLGVDVIHFTPNWQVVRKLMFESLRRRGDFPVDVNSADRERLLRVPGLGVRGVDRLVAVRRLKRLTLEDVRRACRSIAKVRPFVVADGWSPGALTDSEGLRGLMPREKPRQLELF